MSEQKARRVNQERTSLATAIAGMKHWDWCPICRGGLDTGLECDQCGADLMPIYTAFKESLSGGNPGEPKACTGAEERGISGATGAGQHPDGNPESTGDSAERRSPVGTERTPSPDESNRHHVSKSIVWMAKDRTYRETCYFGHYATAVAWANGGTVIPVEVFEPEAHDLRVTDGCAPDEPQPSEARGDDLAGWLEEMHDYARPIDQPKLMQAAALLRSSHEPEGVLALVKQKRDEYRSFLDAGKGTWPGSDYIQDETWARWQGAWSVLDSIVSQAERERPCLFDKLVGNPLDGFPSTKDGEPT